MRVLWLTTSPPDPTASGGGAHEHELLRWAADRHEVTVVAGQAPGARAERLRSTDADRTWRTETVEWRRPAIPGRLGLIAGALRGHGTYDLRVAEPLRRELVRHLRQRGLDEVDLVHVSWADLAPVAARTAARRATAAWFSDSFTRHAERELAATASRRHQALAALELRNARRWERRWYGQPHALATASEIDAAAIEQVTGRRPLLLPVMLASSWFDPPRSARQAATVVFCGALDYRPNVDAVLRLCVDLWPRVLAGRSDAHLVVAGRAPVPEVISAVATAGGELLPDVADAREVYWRAAVVLLPIRLGSGMKNKVLHAFACGAPVVATSAAVEGIGVVDGVEALVADDDEGLVEAALATLECEQDVGERTAAADVLARRYRPACVGPALDDLWTAALTARGSGS